MVYYHAMVDVYWLFGDAWNASGVEWAAQFVLSARAFTTWADLWGHQVVLWFFFAICGVGSCYLSGNSYKRAAEILAVAVLLTLGTMAGAALGMGEDVIIRFGVLDMLGFSVLACAIIRSLVKLVTKNRFALSSVFLILAVVIFIINSYINNLDIPDGYYKNAFYAVLHKRLGGPILSPADFFGIIPNLGMVMVGAGLGPLLYRGKKSLLPFLDGGWQRPISFFGRHTLAVVVLHQLVILPVFMLMSLFFITGDFVI